MTKEERKQGLDGGGPREVNNKTPNFPILSNVRTTDKFRRKCRGKHRTGSQRGLLGVSIVIVLCGVFINTLSLFQPSYKDNDRDGIPDLEEFVMGTDPTVYDESFLFVRKDEMDGVKLEYRVEVPSPCNYDIEIDTMHVKFVRQSNRNFTSIAGYIVPPFLVVNKKVDVKAEIVLEFNPALLKKPHFEPAIFRFSMDHQDQRMVPVPFTWDGQSNVIHVDVSSAGYLGPTWEYYFLDGYEW